MKKPKKHTPRVTAKDIIDLLRIRHSADACVSECKTGGSGRDLGIIDFWALKKSWAHPLVTAYEVKVSRSDFVNDTKWHGYLPYCNCFYFVAPPGIINPDELGEDVGLVVTSQNCTRVYCKKKAPFRDVVIPEDLYRYILMCRSEMTSSCFGRFIDNRADNVSYWREWLEIKEDSREIGHRVSEALGKKYASDVRHVENENQRLEKILKEAAECKAELKAADMWPPSEWKTRTAIKDQLEEKHKGLPSRFIYAAKNLSDQLETIAAMIEDK